MTTTNEQPDLCECGHEGYDGHDMRSVPPVCMTPGCDCGEGFAQLILTADPDEPGYDDPRPVPDSESLWTVAALTARMKRDLVKYVQEGDVPATVESLSAVHDHIDGNILGTFGFGTEGHTLPSMGWEDGWSQEAKDAVEATVDRFNKAGDAVDRWIKDGGLLDAVGAHVVYLRVVALRHPDDEPFTHADLVDGLLTRLEEVYPVGSWPVTPTVTVLDLN